MPPWPERWIEALRGAERWLLPPECLHCRRQIFEADEPLVCRLCRARWRPLSHPRCPRCWNPLTPEIECRMCREWPPGLAAVQSAVILELEVRHLIHRFKYSGWWRLASSFARAMEPMVSGLPDSKLIPIPTSRSRRRRRGYDQAEVLTRELARLSGQPALFGVLTRSADSRSQTGLGAAERLANLSDAFRSGPLSGPVILVDDVFTTGATLVSAATVLLEAGATSVAAVTFARAEPPLVATARELTTDSSLS